MFVLERVKVLVVSCKLLAPLHAGGLVLTRLSLADVQLTMVILSPHFEIVTQESLSSTHMHTHIQITCTTLNVLAISGFMQDGKPTLRPVTVEVTRSVFKLPERKR